MNTQKTMEGIKKLFSDEERKMLSERIKSGIRHSKKMKNEKESFMEQLNWKGELEEKFSLLQRISQIHADRCKNSTRFIIAVESFKVLDTIKGMVINAKTKEQLNLVDPHIDNYSKSSNYRP